jgi:ribose transport system permease protein
MAVDTTPPTVDVRARLRQVPVQELVLPIVIIALIIVGVIIRPGVFLTSDNLLNVLTQASITGIIAIGMTFVIATGGIDLSVGSVLAAACIAGGLLADYGSWMFMLGAIGFALLLGCINGLAITWGKVVPFIATLAMLTIARGLALWMSDKTPISLIELEILQGFGSGRVLGVPVPALVFVAVAIAGWVLLNRTTFGRRAIAVGGNRSAARIAGIRPGRVIFAVYALTGLCVGISAILLSGRLASASPVVGNLVELDAIAAVVIGGTALTGGKATVTGTFFGVITFGLIFNLLNLLNMPTEIQGIVKGVLILIAVALQRRD